MNIAPVGQNYNYAKKQASFKGRAEELVFYNAVEARLEMLPVLNESTITKQLDKSYKLLKRYFRKEHLLLEESLSPNRVQPSKGQILRFAVSDGECIDIKKVTTPWGDYLALEERSLIDNHCKIETTTYGYQNNGLGLFKSHEQKQVVADYNSSKCKEISQETCCDYDQESKTFIPV